MKLIIAYTHYMVWFGYIFRLLKLGLTNEGSCFKQLCNIYYPTSSKEINKTHNVDLTNYLVYAKLKLDHLRKSNRRFKDFTVLLCIFTSISFAIAELFYWSLMYSSTLSN